MSRLFYHVMQDNVGNLLFDVSGTMRVAGSGTLATIYGDEALTVVLPNPMTNHPSFGSFKCFLGAGDYDFYMAKAGYTFETLTGVQGHGTMAQQNANAVAITGGSVVGLTGLSTSSGTHALLGNVGIGGAPTADVSLTTGPHAILTPNVGIGVTPAQPFDCGVNARFQTAVGIGIVAPTSTFVLDVNGNALVRTNLMVSTTTGQAYNLYVGGTIGLPGGTANIINSTSMRHLKQDIQDLTGALGTILRLRGRTWRWADDQPELETMLPGRQVGLIMEEVAEVRPAWVRTNDDGTQGLQIRGFEALMVESLKELLSRLEAVEARLEAAGA